MTNILKVPLQSTARGTARKIREALDEHDLPGAVIVDLTRGDNFRRAEAAWGARRATLFLVGNETVGMLVQRLTALVATPPTVFTGDAR